MSKSLEANGVENAAPFVSVVLPCLNEGDSVGLCVEEARDGLLAAGLQGEIVVVDNGSTDNSALVARRAGARVVMEDKSGYGQALQTGILAARGSVVVMADADRTYDLASLGRLVAPVLAGEAEVMIGMRLNGVVDGSMPLLHRWLGTPALTFLIRRATGGLAVRDSQSGFRAFRRDLILDLGLEGTGMEFASEMLIRSARAGLRVSEVETEYRQRIGESKLRGVRDGFRHLQLILLLAPDLFLLGPGAALLFLGFLLTVWGIVAPGGLQLGSLRWQPVFFSSIAVVLGSQMVLAGALIANRSSLTTGTMRSRFAFTSTPNFFGGCLAAGVGATVLGLLVDAALFAIWVTEHAPPSRGVALAALAQSLLIVGCSLALFGVICRWLSGRDGKQPRADTMSPDLVSPPVLAPMAERKG